MYFDAHQHLHDERLDPFRAEILAALTGMGVCGGVVNGTSESDWGAVAGLCQENPQCLPAFGIHPWHAGSRTEAWERSLTAFLDRFPHASVGETGLDCWIEGHDLADQTRVFVRHLAVARERNLAITIHCVRAHEPLRQILQKHAAPARGFLLHAWQGPATLTDFFLERGACFSFPPYFLHARKSAQREFFRSLPLERVLVETDAPALLPPPEHNRHPLTHPESGQSLNHPANLVTAYEALAALRNVDVASLAAAVAENRRRLFA